MHEQPHKNRLRRIARATLSVAIIGAVSVTLAMVNHTVVPYGSVTEQRTLALVVPVAPVVMSDTLTVRRRFVGVVEARRESRLGFELGGQVAQVMVDEGDTVRALTGREPEDFATIARRYVAERPEAQRGLGNKLRAIGNFLRLMFTRPLDMARLERERDHLLLRNPSYATQSDE